MTEGGSTTKNDASRMQLGELLLSNGTITQDQLEQALAAQHTGGHSRLLGEVLVELGFVSQATIMEVLAQSYGVPFARVAPRIADPRAVESLPRDFIDAHGVLPLFCVDEVLTMTKTLADGR